MLFRSERLVKERTSELKGSENKYRSVIDRVSDAFVSLDKDWNYTFVNKKAGEIFARKPETLIGKNIWTEFPEWKDQPFYHVYYRAMETQTYQYLEEYYPAVDKWFESHVYPSNNGLTIFFKDVTEIKQVLLALKINEEKYRILIEQASDGIVITDLAGEILEVNHSIKQMLGYAGEEMIGYPLTVFLPDDDIAAIPLRINELMQGKNLMYERRLLKKDGTVLDVEINSKMASSHTLIGFIRDITQRIKISADLKKSIERYELIAAATNDVIWDHDFENNITWGNKSLYRLYGVEAGTTAINFEMFINQIHPDDQEGIKTGFEEAVKNRQSSITEEFRFKNAEGEYRIFYDRAFIKYDDVANPERILGAMQDITEAEKVKKQIIKEKELSDSIINSLPGVFYLYNKEGKFLRWNKNFETVTGYTGKEIAQMHPLNFFDDTDQELLTKKITNVFVAGRDEVEADFLLKNKEKILYFFTGQAIEYEGQTCLMGVGIDFSERKKAVDALHNSEQKYRLLFYNNPLPMWMATIPDLDIIDVNEAAIKHYGYAREEFLKLNAKDMRPAEDVEHFVNEVKKMKPGINNIRSWRHKKKDGTIIHVEIYSHKIFYEGQRIWLGLSHDVTEKYEAKAQLQKSYEDIRQLAANLQNIREDERTNIAREIHDELGQQLTGLKMDLHWLTRKINSSDEEVNKKMKESVELINATITSVRKIATDLRPSILDDLGLLAALEWQSEEFENRSGTKVKFINEAGGLTVKPEVATALFRIYQELLTNVFLLLIVSVLNPVPSSLIVK